MNPQDPYAILKQVFVARFGPEALAAVGLAPQAPQAPTGAPTPSAMPQGPQGGGMDPNALMAFLSQSEAFRKQQLTEELTRAASNPPITENEAAVFLNAVMAHGARNALAVGN